MSDRLPRFGRERFSVYTVRSANETPDRFQQQSHVVIRSWWDFNNGVLYQSEFAQVVVVVND